MAYEFNAEGWSQFSEAILGANGDQATLTTLLADMGDTFTTGYNTQAEQTKTQNALTQENERLKKANMDLFLRVGEQQAPKTNPETSAPDAQEGHHVDAFLEKLYNNDKGE